MTAFSPKLVDPRRAKPFYYEGFSLSNFTGK
jgi:hypothetical protein